MALQLLEPSPVVIASDIRLLSATAAMLLGQMTGMTGCGANDRGKALVMMP
jgi:hypothetical protein